MSTSGVILVTGGAGFVGSHTVLELLNDDWTVVVVDNLVNAAKGASKPASLERVERLAGKTVEFYDVDLLDRPALTRVFKLHTVHTVIHFAALKAVGESVQKPLSYYKNNVNGTITLLEVMREKGVKSLIFSSSATVYGCPVYLPVDERHQTGVAVTNPYGRTKYFVEEILKDVCSAEKDWSVTLLRYFNPVGAHESGDIGEDPSGQPNNLMPFVSQVAVGRRATLQVFGGDYDTPDGTEKRQLVAFVFTSTHTSLSITTTTSTVPRICIFGPNTLATCAGRRRRKRERDGSGGGAAGVLTRPDRSAPALQPSVGAPAAARPARFLAISFTSLLTVTSTTTTTTFTTNTSTTVSVSILCTAAGMNLETIYCAGG